MYSREESGLELTLLRRKFMDLSMGFICQQLEMGAL